MESLVAIETLVIELLVIVATVALVVRRLRLPYTVALVIVGLLLSVQQPLRVDLTPELILSLFLPPLVFEAAFHLEYTRLRSALLPILVLAVPGVVLTTLIVGWIVSAGAGLPLAVALVFGALISATDPVAVVALFRALGAPQRLVVLVEGESLFNDGTAIVIFNLVLAIALPQAGAAAVGPLFVLVEFGRVAIGGVAIGLALGWLATLVIARIDDHLIETTLTTVLAFGAYLLAERIHASGVLAVVAAGIVCGSYGLQTMSPTTRIALVNFWEYLAFVANSLVFLLIGLAVNVPLLLANLWPILVAVLAVVASRVLTVYGLARLPPLRGRQLSMAYQHVLVWGGLRGAVGLALVLSLPAGFPARGALQAMAFGVVLFTLLVQGTTMNALLRRLHLIAQDPGALEYERRHGWLMAALAARQRLETLFRSGMISPATWDQVVLGLDRELEGARVAQQLLLRSRPELQAEELDDVRREGLRAQRAELLRLVANGVISEQVYEELVTAVDAAFNEVREGKAEQRRAQSAD